MRNILCEITFNLDQRLILKIFLSTAPAAILFGKVKTFVQIW